MGFNERVLSALALLTHDPAVEYMDHVRAISADPIAKAVKLADLRHNSDLIGMSGDMIDEWAMKRQEKYLKAIELLKGM